MNPLMLYQNYHLVHHIHPTIPFYRYVQAWRRAESDYLDRGAPISTAWGSELSPAEYRAWRQITDNVDRDADLPRRPHRLRVAEVRRLTPDAVSVTFEVPGELRETFRFLPGQNVVVGRRDRRRARPPELLDLHGRRLRGPAHRRPRSPRTASSRPTRTPASRPATS